MKGYYIQDLQGLVTTYYYDTFYRLGHRQHKFQDLSCYWNVDISLDEIRYRCTIASESLERHLDWMNDHGGFTYKSWIRYQLQEPLDKEGRIKKIKRLHDIPCNHSYNYSIAETTEDNTIMDFITTMTNRAKNQTYSIGSTLLQRQVIPLVTDKVRDHFGFTTMIKLNDAPRREIIKWILKYKNPELLKKKELPNFYDTTTMVKFDKQTFMIIRTGKNIYQSSLEDMMLMKEIKSMNENDISIYIFGKRARTYQKELNILMKSLQHGDQLLVYTVTGESRNDNKEGMSVTIQDMKPRDMDTLFFRDGTKEAIKQHIDLFFEHRDIYAKRNISYKTGILLYGQPGTGKTSLANAIATYCNRNLVIVDMTTFSSLDIGGFTASINADDQKYVILLEDIDCIFDSLNREEGTDRDDKKVINKLLQLLDSNNSPNDVIFVATTNHIEKLDSAITRNGRFDLKKEIDGIDYAHAMRMCESFDIPEDEAKKLILDHIDLTDGINQSYLQSLILERV